MNQCWELNNEFDHLPEKHFDVMLNFITLFHTNRFYKVNHILDRSLDKVLSNPKKLSEEEEMKVIKEVHSLNSLKEKLSNRDKRYIPWFNYRYFKNYSEYFKTVAPVINEEATSSDQIHFLEKLYPSVVFWSNVFSGQKIKQPYKCLDYEGLDLSPEIRSYISSSAGVVRGFINDYLEVFKIGFKNDCHNLDNRNELLRSFLKRHQLKSALFSWYTREKYPFTPSQYKMLNLKFRDNLYKKVYSQKLSYLKAIENIVGVHKLDTMSDVNVGILTPLEQEKLKMK